MLWLDALRPEEHSLSLTPEIDRLPRPVKHPLSGGDIPSRLDSCPSYLLGIMLDYGQKGVMEEATLASLSLTHVRYVSCSKELPIMAHDTTEPP